MFALLSLILLFFILILIRQEILMSQFDDLSKVVVDLGNDISEIQANVLSVLNLIQAQPPTPDITDSVAKLQAIHNALGSVDASLKAVVPPVVTDTPAV